MSMVLTVFYYKELKFILDLNLDSFIYDFLTEYILRDHNSLSKDSLSHVMHITRV